MAINPETQYPGKIEPASTEFPYGKARNITLPSDGTGTPWEAALVNDIFGFQQSLLDDASIVPSGTPDEVGASQYLDAINIIKRIMTLLSNTESEATLTVEREFTGTAADRIIAARFINTNETAGGQDYQNEVHIRLRAGTTANHRRYIGFEKYTGEVEYLFGINASSSVILYDDVDNLHRFYFENNAVGNGDTNIVAAGTGKIRLGYNPFPTESPGDGGVQIWDGGLGSGNLLRFDFESKVFRCYDDAGVVQVFINGDTGLVQSKGEIQAISGFRSATFTIADDAADSFDLPGSVPAANLTLSCNGGSGPQGMYWVRASASPSSQLLTINANAEVATGVLNGTTGTDTKFTVSPANDGKVYLENRTGAALTITVTIVGAT